MNSSHAIAITAMLTTLMGCQSLDLRTLKDADVTTAGPRNPVTEIVCLWEPAEGIGLDNQPARGFAGQVLFFTAGQPEPVRVEGDVRIYLFDNHGTVEEQGRPIHQFDFSAEAWNTHLRETNLGATYQLFVPYTRKGGYAADGVLRVHFIPKDGYPIYSKMSSIHLAGRRAPQPAAADDGPRTADTGTTPPTGLVVDDLLMPIDIGDVTSRQQASLSLQRSASPNLRGLGAAVSQVLQESANAEMADAVDQADNVEHESSEAPPTGRFRLAPRRSGPE